jgi:hypothetical protein
MDSAYWDVESIEGSFYTNNGVDDKTGWMHGFHVPTRDVTTVDFFKWVEQHRTNPELNNPNFCKVIVLDPAGEWHVKNTTFMESATLAWGRRDHLRLQLPGGWVCCWSSQGVRFRNEIFSVGETTTSAGRPM